MPEPAKVAAIRALLPATGAGIYLNAGTAGPMPSETQRAMDEQAQRELAVGRGLPDILPEILERMGEARASVAAAVVADPDDIALTHGVSDGLNLVVNALPWRAGDRVLTTRHEHPGGLGPLLALRERLGVEVTLVDVGNGGDDDRTIGAFAEALERPARAILASHVTWTTGATLPVGRLGELARAAGAVSIIDGAQAAGAIPVSVEGLGVDAYALPATSGCSGPRAWAPCGCAGGSPTASCRRTRRSSRSRPSTSSTRSCTPAPTGSSRPASIGPRSSGSRAAAAGCRCTSGCRGPTSGPARLASWAADRLDAIPGVTLVTPRSTMATLVTFRIAGWTAAAAVPELGMRTFAILRDLPTIDALRISVGFWTTEDELERFAAGVELLAGHTPDTLPPRRTLDDPGQR